MTEQDETPLSRLIVIIAVDYKTVQFQQRQEAGRTVQFMINFNLNNQFVMTENWQTRCLKAEQKCQSLENVNQSLLKLLQAMPDSAAVLQRISLMNQTLHREYQDFQISMMPKLRLQPEPQILIKLAQQKNELQAKLAFQRDSFQRQKQAIQHQFQATLQLQIFKLKNQFEQEKELWEKQRTLYRKKLGRQVQTADTQIQTILIKPQPGTLISRNRQLKENSGVKTIRASPLVKEDSQFMNQLNGLMDRLSNGKGRCSNPGCLSNKVKGEMFQLMQALKRNNRSFTSEFTCLSQL